MKPDAAVADEEEIRDGAEIEANEENNDPEHQPGGEQDPNAGREAGKAGTADEKVEGEDGEEKGEEEVEVDPRDERISSLEAQIKEIREGKAAPEAKAQPAAAPPVIYTDEQKAQIAERYGVQDFKTVEAFSGMVAQGMQSIRQEMLAQLSRYEKDNVISRLSKEKDFSDINSYRGGIDEYLKKFSPQYHGDPEIIKDGLAWAKGRGLKKTVAKAVNTSEKNRRIAGAARPAAPSGGNGSKSGGLKFKLTASEESAYASFGKIHFKSKEDYARSLKRFKNSK